MLAWAGLGCVGFILALLPTFDDTKTGPVSNVGRIIIHILHGTTIWHTIILILSLVVAFSCPMSNMT